MMDVKFLRGLAASYAAIVDKDSKTFYYTTDDSKLYLGSLLLSNDVTAAQFEALEGRVATLEGKVATLEDWKALLVEVSKDNGTNDLVKVTVTTENGAVKAVAVDDAALDQKLADDLAAAKKYTDDAVEGIVSGSGYATQTWVNGQISAHEEAQATRDAAQTEALQAEIDADVKVVTDYIAEHEAAWLEKYDDTALKAAQKLVDEAQDKALADYKAEMVTAMANADTAAQGYASAAESAAKGYADQKLLDFENAYIKADDNKTIDKLNEIAAWISDDKAGAVKIISDVATNEANIKTINESAVMTSGITATKVGEYDAVKTTVDSNKSKWDAVENKLDAATYNTFVGTTHATLDAAVAAANAHADAKDADIAKGVEAQGWGNHATQGYAKTADIEASLAKADSALQEADLAPYSTTEQMNAAISTATNDMATNAGVAAVYATQANLATTEANAQQGITDAAAAKAAADAAQGEVDALEEVVAQNAQTCQNNFTTIVNQLTWGTF